MSYTLPFARETVVSELVGKKMVACTIYRDGYVGGLRQLQLEDNKGWFVRDGVLYISDSDGYVLIRVNSETTENGGVFLTGESLINLSCGKPVRTGLYEHREIGEDFHIVISSHVKYEQATLPRLIRSLKREGYRVSDITVVVGGSPVAEVADMPDYTRVAVAADYSGWTGLIPFVTEVAGYVMPLTSYILLLHDTCEVTSGFGYAMKTVDAGLPYDFIGITPTGNYKSEVGFWSVDTLVKMRTDAFRFDTQPTTKIFPQVAPYLVLHRVIGDAKKVRDKDVYGTGNKRQVIEYCDICLKKYLGSACVNGKP